MVLLLFLTLQGGFEAAKAHAAQQGRWLLLNVQSQSEFASHRLNRDTWCVFCACSPCSHMLHQKEHTELSLPTVHVLVFSPCFNNLLHCTATLGFLLPILSDRVRPFLLLAYYQVLCSSNTHSAMASLIRDVGFVGLDCRSNDILQDMVKGMLVFFQVRCLIAPTTAHKHTHIHTQPYTQPHTHAHSHTHTTAHSHTQTHTHIQAHEDHDEGTQLVSSYRISGTPTICIIDPITGTGRDSMFITYTRALASCCLNKRGWPSSQLHSHPHLLLLICICICCCSFASAFAVAHLHLHLLLLICICICCFSFSSAFAVAHLHLHLLLHEPRTVCHCPNNVLENALFSERCKGELVCICPTVIQAFLA